MKSTHIKENTKKILMNLRRGMYELELIIRHFFKEKYKILTEKEKNLFTSLLQLSDFELFNLLIKQKIPKNNKFRSIIQLILKNKKLFKI